MMRVRQRGGERWDVTHQLPSHTPIHEPSSVLSPGLSSRKTFVRRNPAETPPFPPLLGLVAVGALCFYSWTAEVETNPPSRITCVMPEPGQRSIELAMPSRALRGCCGEPTEFQWVFLDSAVGPVGTPVRTKVIALDAQGRLARPAACAPLRVSLDLSGRAQLSASTSLNSWRNAELELVIENDIVETVLAEVRIENPDPTIDVLLHSSTIRFIAGNGSAVAKAAVGEASRPKDRPQRLHAYGNAATDNAWKPFADEVREAFLHAWRGYKKHAWGRDELMPVSKKGKDTFGGVGMTIIDSLSTLWLMGLKEEFEEAATYIEKELDFDRVTEDVSVFELNIRALGGLMGAHGLTKRQLFLNRAEEIARRLLPALNTSSRFPWPKWNIARGRGPTSSEPTILAEAGSLQLELRQLSRETKQPRYAKAGDNSFAAIQASGLTGLLPVFLTPPAVTPPRAVASKLAIGALADSYYEYLLKQWLQSPEETQFKDLWVKAMDELPMLVRPKDLNERVRGGGTPKFKLTELTPQGNTIWKMDHLSCFTPGMLALGLRSLPATDLEGRNSTWWRLAEGLTESCVEMWASSKTGLSPEHTVVKGSKPFDFAGIPAAGRHSFLRPETVESLFYMFRFTGDEKYRRYGMQIFQAIVRHARAEAGFATVQDVDRIPAVHVDEMQSFVFAETFKYLYLLFSPADALDLDKYVLNTEAHPFERPE